MSLLFTCEGVAPKVAYSVNQNEDEQENRSVVPQMIAIFILVAVALFVGAKLSIQLADSIKGSGDQTAASILAGVGCLFVNVFVGVKLALIIASSLFDKD